MSAADPRGNRGQVRDVQQSLTAAADSQIARVVAMVDGLADRTAADALIDPLRPRLAHLRPPRPLRLARVLFVPLDAVIIPAPRWRPGQPAVPRTALVPLADAVRAAAPAFVARAEALLDGCTTTDAAAIAQAGAVLWPAASEALLAATPPPSWAASGLPEGSFAVLARAIGGVFGQAIAIQRLATEARFGIRIAEGAVEAILAAVSAHGGPATDLATAILVAELPDPAPLMARLAADRAQAADAATRARAERLTDALLERLDGPDGESRLAGAELAAAGAEVRRAALLLDALDAPGASSARRQRVHALRKQLDGNSRARFLTGVEQEFTGPLRARLAEQGELETAGLEAAARGLRQLEAAGRALGGGAFYDDLLRRTAAEIRGLPEGAGLTRADKVRLMELLAGSDEASAALVGW